ncbi:MAG: sugar phosphate isomerase/epimerase [Akkermansiaceae bacterium]|nr:sugar phosphate isomerase/epimerase [Akkermansiaceae bacterium]MCF7732159.1 sugar phosphate isomerase/epimerase [Akkermansiaceae bacterium]
MSIQLSRRQFVKNTAFSAAALASSQAFAAPAGRKIPVSVQLYSVRDDCAKDFDGTLAALAKMGVDGVEFAGYHKYDGKPKELRAKLDELGLKAAATHIGTGSLRGDALQKTIDFHQEIGCKFLIVPGDGDFTNPDKNQALADFFNETAGKLKPLGMACGYHNHSHEFAKSGDSNFWEIFAKHTHKEVILQIDFGWAAVAGQDCPALVKNHPGRTRVVHLKPTVVNNEAGKKAIYGEDSVNWPPILTACRDFGGTQWFTLEQEAYPDGKSPMESTALSFAALKRAL